MRYFHLPLACTLVVVGSVFPAVPLSLAASPPPATPTSVLPLLSQPPWSRRYDSPLAPYSVVSPWPGHPAVWPEGRWDQFENDGRIMEIEGERAVSGATTAQAVQELIGSLHASRARAVRRLGLLRVAAQRVPVFLADFRDGWMARLSFVAAGRVWMLSLNTDGWHRDADLSLFVATVRSFQLTAPGA